MTDKINHINRLVPGLIEQVGSRAPVKPEGDKASSASFSDLLGNVINSVNDIHQDAATAQDALLAGEPVELHDVMIKAEEAGLATELLLQVRNKLVSAYNEIMRMPV